jgi:ubiquitin-activating enzyme E1 C
MVCPFVMNTTDKLTLPSRKYLNNILSRPGPFTDPDWVPGEAQLETLARAKIL